MRIVKNIGLILFLVALAIFTGLIFSGDYRVIGDDVRAALSSNDIQSTTLEKALISEMVGTKYANQLEVTHAVANQLEKFNAQQRSNEQWDQVIHKEPQAIALSLLKESSDSPVTRSPWLWLLFTFGMGVVGALMYIVPDMLLLGPAGIKNNDVYHSNITNRGWLAWLTLGYLVTFYILLYFFPAYVAQWVLLVDPISRLLSTNPASQWFLYGLLYTVIMSVMAMRMIVKYRHNVYQVVRTCVVLFFQIAFAFIIPEILTRLNQPSMDLKNAWPLNYTFFFDWNINNLIQGGNLGIFMLVWGIVLTLIVVPVLVYFYGKRWYCSWVCGCGGLAETLGDPFRQHSDKSLKAWKVERYLIHGVLVFAIFMTVATLFTFFTSKSHFLGLATYKWQSYYGFLIGSIFAGVIGTGFYPIWGNRVWCRFGCPLAAYMGIVQRFKSRFRITTNGAQCISCGNCSTYCEQGIDVRWYAQRGENIVRASCVGCGVCSAVCPRGVLKLENGPEENRINSNPIMIGSDGIKLGGL